MTKNKNQPPEKRSYRLLVREVAAQRGFTAQHLARAAGLPVAIVQQICEEETSDLHLSALDALARVLGVSIHDLIEDHV